MKTCSKLAFAVLLLAAATSLHAEVVLGKELTVGNVTMTPSLVSFKSLGFLGLIAGPDSVRIDLRSVNVKTVAYQVSIEYVSRDGQIVKLTTATGVQPGSTNSMAVFPVGEAADVVALKAVSVVELPPGDAAQFE